MVAIDDWIAMSEQLGSEGGGCGFGGLDLEDWKLECRIQD